MPHEKDRKLAIELEQQIMAASRKIKQCWEKEQAFCSSACPFNFDVREFNNRLRRGSFSAAYRLYANSVGFPDIVMKLCHEPCRADCPRQKMDEAIAQRALEQAAIAYTPNKDPNRYNLPQKEGRFAIVGAGPSGLACALRLCNRKYRVTVFEQSGRIGGHLWELLDEADFMPELERQFKFEEYELSLSERVDNPASLLNEFDAVYYSPGADAPLPPAKDGLFSGGSLYSPYTAEAIAQGLNAANLLEAYFKTRNMKEAEPKPLTRMRLDESALSYAAPIPVPPDGYTKEQTVAEAQRCIGCRCDACFRNCSMMAYFQKFPLRIEDEVEVSIHPGTLDGDGTVATRLIATCNQCGLCAEACPQDIDVGHYLRLSHQFMDNKSAMPWAFHDFWLRDMAHALGEESAFTASPADQPRYLYFPGCQLGASAPEYVLGSYALLCQAEPATAVSLGCCGAPAIWAGDITLQNAVLAGIRETWQAQGKPMMVLACPTCLRVFSEHLPDIPQKFLFDVFSELGIKPEATTGDYAVFDPCAMRRAPLCRENARALAQEAGLKLGELPYHGERARCCSFGGQIDGASPSLARHIARERVGDSPLPYLVYCANCRDIFAGEGKQALHLLELFPGCTRADQAPPGIEQRRRNRVTLKQALIKRHFSAIAPPSQPEDIPLELAPGLAQKLDRERVFIADILAVIDYAEQSGQRLRNEEGRFIAYRKLGFATYWAEYSPQEGGYLLHNAYSHRMEIDTEGAHE